MKNAILLSTIFAAALAVPAMAADTPGTKTAGDMVYWFTSAPQYGLDEEGYSNLRMCHAKALDTKSIPDTVKHLDGCNKEALKNAYYDIDRDKFDLHNRDKIDMNAYWNRPMVRTPR